MRATSSTLFQFALVLAGLVASPAWANDPHAAPADAHGKPAEDAHGKPAEDAHGKPADAHADPHAKGGAPAEPEKPKFDYVKEDGVTARGYTYKRVARPKEDLPKPVPKAPPAPPPEPEKKEEAHGGGEHGGGEHGGGGHEEPKKEEPKKEAKKEEHGGGGEHGGGEHGGGGHGGGHGAPEKPKPPTDSLIYDKTVIRLDGNNRPFTPVVQSNEYADYFMCYKTISTKYAKQVLSEINTFADRMGLPHAMPLPCMIKVAKPDTKFPGAVYVEFYVSDEAAVSCIRYARCGSTRLMMLHLKDKTGLKSKEIYRSYVITDEKKYNRKSFCVSPDGHLLGEKNCYVALNPDWLFN
jgi:hypothetical protein